ncbi:hypothetical protein ST37_18395 [Vibrio sp. qd031]|uniref:hypothetical protein n=1 Tax=Vibrio sp. qd031 TaxID=1603038 RepID=UPI000A0F6BB4|nr:hypothetical protein [Vibrio sp. qd031]ORT48194.1 hypothetical protein ST37_18395 [Vibrio sp. qd031]
MIGETNRYKQLVSSLSQESCLSLNEQLQRLCHERWVIAIQTPTKDSAVAEESIFKQCIELLDHCGYHPSFAWLSESGPNVRLIERTQSPFLVMHLPTEIDSESARGLTIHTLLRCTYQPMHLSGAVLHSLAKVVIWNDDDWAQQHFTAAESVSQLTSIAHNAANLLSESSVTESQCFIASAALHIGVLESVSHSFLSQHTSSQDS